MSDNGSDKKLLLDGWEGITSFLNCSDKFAKKLTQEGMPVYKLGRKIYGVPMEIVKFIQQHPIPRKKDKTT